jgi:hypothetical protein
MASMLIPAMKAGIATTRNTVGRPHWRDSMVPPSIEPRTEPIRPTPEAQLTPVARLVVG